MMRDRQVYLGATKRSIPLGATALVAIWASLSSATAAPLANGPPLFGRDFAAPQQKVDKRQEGARASSLIGPRQRDREHFRRQPKRIFLPGLYYAPEYDNSPEEETSDTSSQPNPPPVEAKNPSPPVSETVRLGRQATTPKGFIAAPEKTSGSHFAHIPGAVSAPDQ